MLGNRNWPFNRQFFSIWSDSMYPDHLHTLCWCPAVPLPASWSPGCVSLRIPHSAWTWPGVILIGEAVFVQSVRRSGTVTAGMQLDTVSWELRLQPAVPLTKLNTFSNSCFPWLLFVLTVWRLPFSHLNISHLYRTWWAAPLLKFYIPKIKSDGETTVLSRFRGVSV